MYALGNLAASPIYTWQVADYAVTQRVQGYWVNFIKTDKPNGTQYLAAAACVARQRQPGTGPRGPAASKPTTPATATYCGPFLALSARPRRLAGRVF